MAKTASESLMSAGLAGLAGGYMVGFGNTLNIMNMNVNAAVGIGATVFVADLVSEWVKDPVLSSVGAQSEQMEMLLPPLVTGAATYALLRTGTGSGAAVPIIALGAISSALGPYAYRTIWG